MADEQNLDNQTPEENESVHAEASWMSKRRTSSPCKNLPVTCWRWPIAWSEALSCRIRTIAP